jgi:hypothetical protein
MDAIWSLSDEAIALLVLTLSFVAGFVWGVLLCALTLVCSRSGRRMAR